MSNLMVGKVTAETRRLSAWPKILAVGLIGIFVVTAAVSIGSRSRPSSEPALLQPAEQTVARVVDAVAITTALETSASTAQAALTPPTTEQDTDELTPFEPVILAPPTTTPRDGVIERAAAEALRAPTGIYSLSQSVTASLPQVSYDERTAAAAQAVDRPAPDERYQAFNSSEPDRFTLREQVTRPGPFSVSAGSIIPAIMITGLNSDLPGQLVAQVSRPVLDTATGRHVLIPQGARLVGQYESMAEFGQNRVLVAWQRILFPDGSALDLGAMPGADQGGYTGLKDQVDRHLFQLFGSAFLLSGVTGSVAVSQQQRDQSNGQGFNQTTSGALSEALGTQLGQVSASLIEKNLSVSPTLTVRPGFRQNVVVTKDLVFTGPYGRRR